VRHLPSRDPASLPVLTSGSGSGRTALALGGIPGTAGRGRDHTALFDGAVRSYNEDHLQTRSRISPPLKILVLDSDRSTVRTLEPDVPGCTFRAAHTQSEGLRLLSGTEWDVILLDADFCGAGLELLTRLRSDRATPVVLLSGRPSMDLTLEAIERGAYDVLSKPPAPGRLREILASTRVARGIRPLGPNAAKDAVIGSSAEMLGIFKAIARAAASDATVLILGESGTGKEMVARVLHARSVRSRGPFVAINCAAIPENLLESELFGHEKGSFTGAIGRRIGRFERANGGTLFLDEIGDMSFALQSKVLRALQEREIERVGGTSPVPIDVRIVAATNRDLAREVREERFREDLFYRLAVVTLKLPPLRRRGMDLDFLVEHFVARYAEDHGRTIVGIAEATMEALRTHPWPGNVRQLRNAIERAVVMVTGDVLLPHHLPSEILNPDEVPSEASEGAGALCTLEEMERRLIRRALRETGSNLTLASERLGIHRNTLRRKIVQYGLAKV
jgi:DNA-binding NtrC family response regulator